MVRGPAPLCQLRQGRVPMTVEPSSVVVRGDEEPSYTHRQFQPTRRITTLDNSSQNGTTLL